MLGFLHTTFIYCGVGSYRATRFERYILFFTIRDNRVQTIQYITLTLFFSDRTGYCTAVRTVPVAGAASLPAARCVRAAAASHCVVLYFW